MDLNYRALLKIAGVLLAVIGVALMLPLVVALFYHETESVRAFLWVMVPSVLVGLGLVLGIRTRSRTFRIREGYLIVAASWILASFIGSLPLVISGAIPNPIDAFFEISSGFTTTGATILSDIEALPRSMLFWRSFTHWIGGMGILVLAVALLPALGIGGQYLAKAETSGPVLSKLTPKFSDTAKMFYLLYFALTAFEIILLLMGGLSVYDALVHTFATVGTGGFSTYNDGIAHFGSAYIEGIITLFMFLSGVSYYLYFLAFRQGLGCFRKDGEFKVYFFVSVVFTVLLSVSLFAYGTSETPFDAFRLGIFQTVSILTTTGFATADFAVWPLFCQMLLFLLFFVGGCSSSTAGGIKTIRLLILGKLVKRTVGMKLHPNVIAPLKLGNRLLPVEVPSGVAAFTFLYLLLFMGGGILLSLEGYDLMTCFGASGACLGNIGPGFAEIGPLSNYSFFSNGSTLFLSFMMIIGRLELFTVIILFTKKFWNPYN